MLSSLIYLDLDNNSITGTIPSEIGMLLSLTDLWLTVISITGTIPSEICEFTNTNIYYVVEDDYYDYSDDYEAYRCSKISTDPTISTASCSQRNGNICEFVFVGLMIVTGLSS